MNTPNAHKTLAEKTLQRMQKARSDLLLNHPFFGSLALKLVLKPDTSCQNLWTDGRTLGFNPLFIESLSAEHIVASQAHELLHLACQHHLRRQGRNEVLWNKACDHAINALLLEAGFSLPTSFVQPDKEFENMSVDEIYILLGKMSDHDIHGGAKNAHIAQHTDEKDSADTGAASADSPKQEEHEAELAGEQGELGNQDRLQDEKNSPSGPTGGTEGENAQKTSDHADFFGEVRDHPLLQSHNAHDIKDAQEDSLIQLTQAMQSAEHYGNIPLNLVRMYNERIRPKLDWQSLLQRFIESCNDGDYSWSMPNRRYVSQDIYLPSRKEPRIPLMALAVDTSGSIDGAALSVFCAELENILESYDSTLVIMSHDIRVQQHSIYTREDRPLRLFLHGGGGTNYRGIPLYMEREGIVPACLLWFTDFECDLFPEEPPYPVLWIATKKPKYPPPFGDVIVIQ